MKYKIFVSSVRREFEQERKFIKQEIENDYILKCKIIEKNETIFEVRTFSGSRDRAKKIVDNWNKNASKIYPKILDMLLED